MHQSPFLHYTRVQKYLGASLTGFTLYLFAVYGSIFGIILFDEYLMKFHYIGGALVFFVWGRWRYDLVAFAVLMVSVVLGLIPPDEAFLGFGHPAVITVGAVLIISRTLSSSGFIDVLTSRLASLSNHTPGNHIGILGGLASILSAFMNNVGALAMLMPVAIKTAKQAKRSPSLI